MTTDPTLITLGVPVVCCRCQRHLYRGQTVLLTRFGWACPTCSVDAEATT